MKMITRPKMRARKQLPSMWYWNPIELRTAINVVRMQYQFRVISQDNGFEKALRYSLDT